VGTTTGTKRGIGGTIVTHPLTVTVKGKIHRRVKRNSVHRFIFATDQTNQFVCERESSVKPLRWLMPRSPVAAVLPGCGAAPFCYLFDRHRQR